MSPVAHPVAITSSYYDKIICDVKPSTEHESERLRDMTEKITHESKLQVVIVLFKPMFLKVHDSPLVDARDI